MTDKREEILVRIEEIAQTVTGIKTVGRNINNVDDIERPAIQILDGGEQAMDEDPRQRPSAASRRVGMSPEIYIVLGGLPENVGPKLNVIRAEFVKKMLEDTVLKSIVGENGLVRYEGCATSLSRAGQIEGEMGLDMLFMYILRPGEL